MKKSTLLSIMFIIGACSTEPKLGNPSEDIRTPIDPNSEIAQDFIKKFNAKGYLTKYNDGRTLTFNDKGELIRGNAPEAVGTLYSFKGE